MTFEPPSPEQPWQSGESVSPPAGGSGEPAPAGGRPSVGAIALLDWVLLGLGLATLIVSLIPGYYHFEAPGYPSYGWNAWKDIAGGGFFGWLGVVLTFLAAVVLALVLFQPDVTFPMTPRALVLLGFSAGFVCELVSTVLHPKFYNAPLFKLGHGWTFWVLLLLTLAGALVALVRAQQTNTQLPGALGNLPKIGG